MLLNKQTYPYLNGEKFSASGEFKFRKNKYQAKSRADIILDITRGKSVIHVGCTDHLEIIDQKIEQNIWLHKLLSEQSSDCFGIDLNEESIKYLTEELGYDNVEKGDIIHDDFSRIKSKKWDYVLFGEIVEHLDNPVEFLSTFRSKYKDDVDNFIITVPNILNRAHFKDMNAYRELINTDHRFWFTPFTISKVIVASGFTPENIFYGNPIKLTTWGLIRRKLKKILGLPIQYPFMHFNTLIITGKV